MRYGIINTKAGSIGAASSPAGILRLTLPQASDSQAVEALGHGTPLDGQRDDDAFSALAERLRRYYQGDAVDFDDFPLDLSDSTPFQREVLERVRAIPRGSLVSYGVIAAQAGRPGAARAVGAVMASNPICIVVPCHRVVTSDGGLGGFGGGLPMKERMLIMEGALLAAPA